MADGFSMSMLTKPTMDAMADMAKRTDRATMWALREVGRQIKREARKRAPVYKGVRAAATHREMKALAKAGMTGSTGNVVISGLLKNSIGSSRRFKREAGGAYIIKVGPRGERTHLYAGKIEARQAYMRPAYDQVTPQMAAIHAKAWERAMRKK